MGAKVHISLQKKECFQPAFRTEPKYFFNENAFSRQKYAQSPSDRARKPKENQKEIAQK